jgi:hypothetical protein
MKNVRRFPKWFFLGSALALSLNVAACGDDDDPPHPDAAWPDAAPVVPDAGPDAANPDAGVPDAAPPMSTRAGTIAVMEVSVAQIPATAGGAASGASVFVEFTDLATATVAPVYSDVDVTGAGCVVTVYDLALGQVPSSGADEGPVTVTGTLSPIPPCAYIGTDYVCIAGMGAAVTGDIFTVLDLTGDGIPESPAFQVAAGFGNDKAGMFISISGATGASNNGEFPVMAVLDLVGSDGVFETAIIGNPVPAPGSAAGATYVLVAGAGPTPSNVPFLDDGTADITIAKGASTEVEGFGPVLKAGGSGYDLDDASATPQTMPTDGTAASLSCSGTGGACGTALVTALSGYTTDGALTGLPPYLMPAPMAKFASFRCATFASTVTVPAAAMAAILGTNPNRIETRVFRYKLAQVGNADGTNGTNILVGHGHVGWTDVP